MGISLLTLLVSFYAGRQVERKAGETGIRFREEVLGAEQLEQFCEKEEKEGKGDVPVMTLWKQTDGIEISGADMGRHAKVKLVDIWGEAEQVYTQCLLLGNTLLKEDTSGCMLSEAAAYELFGSTDILGKQISCQGKTYRVRGILKVGESVFLRENEKAGFTFMEVRGQPGSGVEKIRQMLLTMGVVLEEGAVVETDTLRGMLHFLRLIPLGILTWLLYRKAGERCRGREGILWLVRVGMILVWALVLWKSWCFSEDFIPAKWSDFEFFGDVITEQRENYGRYLDIAEVYRDRALFWDVKNVAVWSIVSGASALGILVRGIGWKPVDKKVYIEEK